MNRRHNISGARSISLFAPARVVTAASALCCLLALQWTASALDPSDLFSIKVVDDKTGRGVPLVELRTVSNSIYYTDSNGVVAFCEPGLINQSVFFFVRSHGYDFPHDGFGNAGVTVNVTPGKAVQLKIKRLNIAERLYRITGEGIYRDSILLGLPTPLAAPLLNAQIAGQDSAMTAVYRGKIYWIWGDTLRIKYPLGNFWSSGAVSALPDRGGVDPSRGIDLCYFVDADGFSRPMWPRPSEGLVWTDGIVVAPDAQGRERMIARYAHMKQLGTMLDHGLGVFDDAANAFERIADLELAEKWRCPHGQPLRVTTDEGDHFYFSAAYNSLAPFPAVRVRAQFESVKNPAQYEAFTPLERGAGFEGGKTRVERSSDGRLLYGWKPNTAPITPAQEAELLKTGILRAEEARYQPRDVDSGAVVTINGGSVNWNAYRNKWIMIAVENGGAASFLGEVWFSEADSLLGPWLWAKKIVTHDRYSFYNPVHHPFFDQDNGRLIYFEGTYTNSFSGTEEKTPRYDYNQIMYRLDLSDPRLLGKGSVKSLAN